MSATRGLSISLSKLNHKQTKSKRILVLLKNQLNSSSVSIISTITLIRSGLDISNLLSTSQKPRCECTRAFLLTARQQLAVGNDGDKKPVAPARAGARLLTY